MSFVAFCEERGAVRVTADLAVGWATRTARGSGDEVYQARRLDAVRIFAWHLLNDPTTRYHDLGPGHYQARTDKNRKARNHIHQLEALGYTVTITQAA